MSGQLPAVYRVPLCHHWLAFRRCVSNGIFYRIVFLDPGLGSVNIYFYSPKNHYLGPLNLVGPKKILF